MPKVKVSALKQTPYGYRVPRGRVDPTKDGVCKAIKEGRYSTKIMDRDYGEVKAEINRKAKTDEEADEMMREYHNERIAELVRTKDSWLDKPDKWPITVNQFNEVVEGNHRFRAIRYLERDEVEVNVVEGTCQGHACHPEIW